MSLDGFILSMAAWIYIIYELWAGEGAKAKNASNSASVQAAYQTMMYIVIFGWAVYPLGYFFGYLGGGADEGTLNLIYNLADFINKILFGVIIWGAAMKDSASH